MPFWAAMGHQEPSFFMEIQCIQDVSNVYRIQIGQEISHYIIRSQDIR